MIDHYLEGALIWPHFVNVNIENQSEVKSLTKSIKFKIGWFTKYHVIISCDMHKSRGSII